MIHALEDADEVVVPLPLDWHSNCSDAVRARSSISRKLFDATALKLLVVEGQCGIGIEDLSSF